MLNHRFGRVIPILLCSFVPVLLHAGTMSDIDNKTLYYIAGNVGILQGNFNTTYSDQTDVIAQNISESFSQQSYEGGVGLGASKIWQNYFIGAELWFDFNTGKGGFFQAGANSTAFTDTNLIENNIDLVFKPGLMLTPDTASYLNLGVSYARVSDRLISPLNSTPVYQYLSQQKWIPGAVLGIGFKKYMSPHWSLFSEYNYHDFGTVSFNNFQNYTANYEHVSHITANTVSVGVAWNR